MKNNCYQIEHISRGASTTSSALTTVQNHKKIKIGGSKRDENISLHLLGMDSFKICESVLA